MSVVVFVYAMGNALLEKGELDPLKLPLGFFLSGICSLVCSCATLGVVQKMERIIDSQLSLR